MCTPTLLLGTMVMIPFTHYHFKIDKFKVIEFQYNFYHLG
ncbi:hypothetical protein F9B77_00065 [Staphylococcus epidermidis]|uniref:Uncharacterized protein n=4 Tax=Staphylococcus TaxID=1279 RepID=Q5HQ46_STAEQ|nr:hypothetical protein SE_0820 [Staphylococcus epidermidis ATCC 12228]AAW54069.1 hypothetical protein SERP0711 [Staphylococcus epidermidis RP62A]ARG66926.1 hypothetical protein B4U56_08240 [Staphylococcus epidermidis]TBW74225.1 hypothetical protein EQ811_13040 [Staphylococcus capitis]AVA11761.1 hypothetical protein AL514_09320 [Staphylococcus epidermidis]